MQKLSKESLSIGSLHLLLLRSSRSLPLLLISRISISNNYNFSSQHTSHPRSQLVRALCEREGYILNVADARRLFKLERIFPTHAQTLQALQIAYGEGSYKKDIEFAQE